MMEFWKSLIEHILSWPVAAFSLCVLFYKPLVALLGRVNNIKAPGFELAAPVASAQIETKAISPPESLRGEIGPTSSDGTIVPAPATGAGMDARREAVQNFGHGFEIVDEGVDLIKKDLTRLDMPLGSEATAEILVRHLAMTQIMLRFERTHRLIFGSQIVALHLLNVRSQPEAALVAIFENARAQEPNFYGGYTFDQWIGFLIKEGAVLKQGDYGQYAITVYGQNYLQYIGVFASAPKPH